MKQPSSRRSNRAATKSGMLNAVTGPVKKLLRPFAPLEWVRWGFIVVPLITVWHGQTVWVLPLAVVVVAASVPLLLGDETRVWLLTGAAATVIAAGGTLWVLEPDSWAAVVVYSTAFQAVRFLPRRLGWAVVALAAVAVCVSCVSSGTSWVTAVLMYAILLVAMLLGANRRAKAQRLEQTELALARAQQATEEHARAAALTERARIARELHDILAHSLSGLSLNLQGARLMLERDGVSAEIIQQIERAQRFAADGLVDARRAVAALRDDPIPLKQVLADLVNGYRMDTGAAAEFRIGGAEFPLDARIQATVIRTVQESLSNTRKHAPGASVRVGLDYAADHLELDVVDQQRERPKASTGTGYGLQGMRERADLIEGTLNSGPTEDGWRVHLAIPRPHSG